jgi:hypothetical protein
VSGTGLAKERGPARAGRDGPELRQERGEPTDAGHAWLGELARAVGTRIGTLQVGVSPR